MTNTVVYFVRHAEPNYDNHDDMSRELSAKGTKDCQRVSRFLSDKNVNVVLSSPFKRAIDTVKPFARSQGLEIEVIHDFRERRVDSGWIDDFQALSQAQWSDFDYKLSDGESLKEVQKRNIHALNEVLERYAGKTLVIGSHGTALSTIINYYYPAFGYEDFNKIRLIMPWIVRFSFEDKICMDIQYLSIF